MIRMLVVFVTLAVLIGLGIQAWRDRRGKERWQWIKIAAFSVLCAVIAVSLLTIFVLLF